MGGVVGVVRVGEWRLGAGSRHAGTGLLDSRYWILDGCEWLNGSLVIPLRGFRFDPRLLVI